MKVKTVWINERALGPEDAKSGERIVVQLMKGDDEIDVLSMIRELMDEDFEDNTIRLDAIHSLIHMAKRLNILPLRTV